MDKSLRDLLYAHYSLTNGWARLKRKHKILLTSLLRDTWLPVSIKTIFNSSQMMKWQNPSSTTTKRSGAGSSFCYWCFPTSWEWHHWPSWSFHRSWDISIAWQPKRDCKSHGTQVQQRWTIHWTPTQEFYAWLSCMYCCIFTWRRTRCFVQRSCWAFI